LSQGWNDLRISGFGFPSDFDPRILDFPSAIRAPPKSADNTKQALASDSY